MANDINQVLYLLKADGTPLENIKIEKFTFSDGAMSLDTHLSGSFLYPDESLLDKLTRQEYVEYQGQKFWLQKTPNIEQKGLLSDNSNLQGMIRYTCEFTPQKSALYNIPFSDIARPNTNESAFRVGGREFYLFSRIDEFVSRIDANLMYHTKESADDPNRWKCVLIEGFDTSGVPLPAEPMSFQGVFISDALKTLYDTYKVPWNILGKTIYVGVPVNEVGHVFKFGQGVGLLNNDRVRKDNKVVTRLAYAGSDRNLPFRYPIIKKKSDGTEINHAYGNATPTRLKPTVYVEALKRKIDTTHSEYNPNIELIDYIDAIGSDYVTQINPNLPVYHYQVFDDIHPTIKDLVYEGNPIDTFKSIVTVDWDDEIDQGTGEVKQPHFVVELYPMGFDLWACSAVQNVMTFWMNTGDCQGAKFQVGYNAEEYQSSFFIKGEKGEPVFDPTFRRRNWDMFPDSTSQSIKIKLLKDIESFGTLMPNQWQKPETTDKFVIINIQLPQIYIDKAQEKLDEAAKQYLIENNFDKFEYPLVFDAHYLADNQSILSQINTNTLVPFEYKGQLIKLPVQTISIQYGDNPIPKYDIKLTDEITVTLNSVGSLTEELDRTNNVIASNDIKGARQAANFFQGLRKAEEGIFDVDGVPKLKLVEALLIKANSLFIGSENRNFAPIDAAMTIGLDYLSITQSQIIHYNISRTAEYDVDEARWFMQPFFINTLNPTKDYYVYIQANRINNSAQWVVLEKIGTNQKAFNEDVNVFWFYWGQLNVINDRRETYPAWGMSVFSGGTQWQMFTKSPNFIMNENQFTGMMIDWLDGHIYVGKDGSIQIGDAFDFNSKGDGVLTIKKAIATGLIFAEQAEIADWIIKDGKITSKQNTQDGTPRAQLNGSLGRITLATDIGRYTSSGAETNIKQTINIDSESGDIASSVPSYNDIAYLTSQGIFANRAGTQAVPLSSGIELKGAMVALGYGDLQKTAYNSLGAICGLFARSNNSNANPAPDWGAIIYKLLINGLHFNITTIDTATNASTSTYLDAQSTFVDCLGQGTGTISVYLPSKPQNGQCIFIRRTNAKTVTIYSNQAGVTIRYGTGGGTASSTNINTRGDLAVLIYNENITMSKWSYNVMGV